MKRLALWCAMTAVSCAAWADDDTALGQNSPNDTVSGSLNLVTENNQTTVADKPNSLQSNNEKISGSMKNYQSDNSKSAKNTTNTHLNHSNNSQADSEKISGSLKDNQADNQTLYPYKSSGSLNIPQNQTLSGSLKGENNQANTQPRTRRVPKDNYQLNLSVSGNENDLTTNNKLTDLLKKHLSLYNRQKTPNMDADQIAFLAQETATEVAQIVATEGFFNSQTEVHENGNQYTIKVNLGKRTTVDNVILVLDG
ncbi:MAG: hypothetical protein J6U05_00345, partial [Neisseriaceae bacterium]|nr:hypothetical protein [Neisseriaceae bacterium]